MRILRALVALIAVSSCAGASARAQPPAGGESIAPLVISGATLVDGTGREPRPGSVIVIQGGQIAAVTTVGATNIPVDGRRLDAHEKWIIPGLIDMHVHYYEWMDREFLRHGVTTVRDVGNALDRILELRRQSRRPDAVRPRVFACGPLIDGPRPRHGTELSASVSTAGRGSGRGAKLIARRGGLLEGL